MTIVLPAYNEEARLGPALDELFGYLRRARPGRAGLPGPERAADDDHGPRRRRRQHRRHGRPCPRPHRGDRPQAPGPADPARCSRCRTAARARRSARACSLATARPRRLRRRRHGDAARPAAAPDARAPRPRRRARQPDPARRPRHAPHPAGLPAGAGRLFHVLASAWVAGPGPGHAVRVQGLPRAVGARPVRDAARHEHRVRRGDHLPRPASAATRSRSCRSSGATGAVRACAPGRASRCSVLWDLFRIPLIHRRLPAADAPSPSGPAGPCPSPDGAAPRAAAQAGCRPFAVAVFVARRRRDHRGRRLHARLRLPGVRGGRAAAARRPSPLRPVDSSSPVGFAIFLYPPPFARRAHPVRAAAGRRGALALAGRPVGGVPRPVSPCCPSARRSGWADRPAGRRCAGRCSTRSSSARSGRSCSCVFAAGWRWLDRPAVSGRVIAAGALIKVQPALLFGWAFVTRRWRALRRRVGRSRGGARSRRRSSACRVGRLRGAAPPGQQTRHHAAQLHAGRDRLPGRRGRGDRRRAPVAAIGLTLGDRGVGLVACRRDERATS